MKPLLHTLAFVLSAAPLLAQAALIDITVTGTVYNSYDMTGNIFGRGAGAGTVFGQIATLTFTYDTATAPGDTYGGTYPYYASYYGGIGWVESSATVGGNAVSNVATSGNYSNSAGIDLADYLPNVGSYDEIVGDYRIQDYENSNGSNGNSFYRYAYSENYFYIHDYFNDFLNGVSLDQTFSVTVDGSGNNWGTASIWQYLDSYECLDQRCSAITTTEYEYGYASIDQLTITMSRRDVSIPGTLIPEPGSLALLGLGMAGLAFVWRRKVVS